MRLPEHMDATTHRRLRITDRILGGLGAAIIATTLFGVRLWARVTRTPYLRD